MRSEYVDIDYTRTACSNRSGLLQSLMTSKQNLQRNQILSAAWQSRMGHTAATITISCRREHRTGSGKREKQRQQEQGKGKSLKHAHQTLTFSTSYMAYIVLRNDRLFFKARSSSLHYNNHPLTKSAQRTHYSSRHARYMICLQSYTSSLYNSHRQQIA